MFFSVVLGPNRSTTGAVTPSGGQQFVKLVQRSQTPTAQQQQVQVQQGQMQPKPAQATKFVVVCMPSASHAQTTVTQVRL